jgi:hypothetical protein
MSDPTFLRGRVTAAFIEDSTDTTSPAGERQALATIMLEDSDVTGGTPVPIQAKVWLPNRVPCPAYAANLHLLQTVPGPGSSVGRASQPLVTVRKDAAHDDGATVCYSITISPTFVVQHISSYSLAGKATYPNQFCKIQFLDQHGNNSGNCLGYCGPYAAIFGYSTMDVAQPSGLAVVTTRLAATGISTAFPGSYNYAWLVNPIHGNTCPATITGGDGVGTPYACDFNYLGFGGAPVTDHQNVLVPMLDTTTIIPVGTIGFAQRNAGVWYFQPPVWL